MKIISHCLAALTGFVLMGQAVAAEILALPIPIRTILPNESLKAEDFTFKEFEVNEIAQRNFLTSFSQIERQTASKVLRAGKPVPLRSLKRMTDVRKGQMVIARYISYGIEIQGMLVPEQDGSIGDVVRAKNPETGVTLNALVAQDGSLAVGTN